ncbi:MAG: glycoside hydrolase family 43 protein [Armatimonadetes bacterium]|nr:glycoside hydrolase family 43 protein [Armatimonadota bacterium]
MNTYTNPVGIPSLAMGDPFVLQTENGYFLYGSTDTERGFECWSSNDLVNWKYEGWILENNENSWGESAFFAPEVKAYRGKYYLSYSAQPRGCSQHRMLMALACSDSPTGPFETLYAPWFDFGYSAIDSHIFEDDGALYLYYSRNGIQDGYAFGVIYGVRLDSDSLRVSGEPVKLLEASQEWERVNWSKNRCNEGAFVFRAGDKLYMTYSANDTSFPTYGVGYATATSPLGTWTKAGENPILKSDIEMGVSGPGHNSLVLSPDGSEMFIVYHAHRDPSRPCWDRVVNIDRLLLDEEGKMSVIGPTRTPQAMPSSNARH